MFGKSGTATVVVATLALISCAHHVAQDKATGPDGKYKEARPISMENGEGRASGIVTYPGGDRVDWKTVELPEKQTGELEIKLQWFPPRPGLQLGFDVFDEWNHRVAKSKKAKKGSRSRGPLRSGIGSWGRRTGGDTCRGAIHRRCPRRARAGHSRRVDSAPRH